MALIHRIAGFDSLLLATSTLLASLYAYLAKRFIRLGLHPMLSILIIAFAFLASASTLHVRPHLFSIIFLCITFSLLCDFEAGRLKLWYLFSLVPVLIIWANVHGGVLGGIGTLAVMVGGWTFAKLIGKESPIHNLRELFLLWVFLVACILTLFINPYGHALHKTWFSIITSQVIPDTIQEHSPAHKAAYGWAILFLAIFYIVAFLGTLPKWPRLSWVIPLIWLALGLSRVRHSHLFAIVTLIAFADFFPHVRWAKWLAKKGSRIFSFNPPSMKDRFRFMHVLIPCLMIASAFFLQIGGVKIPIVGKNWAKLDPNYWPIGILADIENLVKDEPLGTPIFHDMLFGGFLIYYVPQLRVFIDDRCELYKDRALLAYMQADCQQFEEWVRKYDIKIALIERASIFGKCLDQNKKWTTVNKIHSASLYKQVD